MRKIKTIITVIMILLCSTMVQAQERKAFTSKTSVRKLTKMAERGDAVAQFQLGHDYYWGLIENERNFVEARKWLSMAAYNGNAEAQLYLGRIFLYGRNVDKNLAQAYSLFQQALQGGCMEAYGDMGYMIVVEDYPKDTPKRTGIEYLMRSADTGSSFACGYLAWFYLNGIKGLLEQNIQLAKKYASKGSSKGDEISDYVLGCMYCYKEYAIDSIDLVKSHQYFMSAAKQDVYEAQYEVASNLLGGYGVRKDTLEAMKWLYKGAVHNSKAQNLLATILDDNPDSLGRAAYYYELAANQGHAEATNSLGVMYGKGVWFKKDARKSLHYYMKADSLGSKYAANNIAYFFVNGDGGVKKDFYKAYEYFGKAYMRGCQQAKNNVRLINENGNQTAIDFYNQANKEKDNKKKFLLYEKSAKNGNAWANYYVGIYYQDGDVVKKDYNKAFRYLKEAVDNGIMEGLITLGVYYYNGYGCKKNQVEAARLFELAANLGEKIGQYNTGLCYHYEYGVTKDIEKARYWYGLAAAQDYESAKKQLAALDKQDNSGSTEIAKTEEKVPVKQKMRKVALLIGNARYKTLSRLNNSINDATDLDVKLRTLGFETELLQDCGKMEFDKAVTRFREIASKADVAFFYYSGHGIQRNNENYLLPVDINIENDSDKMYMADVSTSLSDVLEKVGQSGCKLKVFVIDACRENPFNDKKVYRNAKKTGGLGKVKSTPEGTLIVYSTAPGKLALDGMPGDRNSPYTKTLLEYIDKVGLEIEDMFKAVGRKIKSMTGQTPYRESSLTEEYYLNPE